MRGNRIWTLCVALVLVMALTACGKKSEQEVLANDDVAASSQQDDTGITLEYEPEGPLEFAEQGILTNTYVDPQGDFTMLYDGSWKVDERYKEFQKGVSILYYRSSATIDDAYAADMNDYAAYVKESVVNQDIVKDINFSTRQDARYFLVEYDYELDGVLNRWTAVCDPAKQIALFFQFCSSQQTEYDKLVYEVDTMLASIDIRSEYHSDGIQVADADGPEPIVDQESVQQNLADRSGLVGNWGRKDENGENDLQLSFNEDGSYARYKSMGDENNCIKGTWEYENGILNIHNTEATIDGADSNNFSADVSYEVVGFADGHMTIRNTQSNNQTSYLFLGND